MEPVFSSDTTEIDREIEILQGIKASVKAGHLEVARNDEGRVVFRLTESSKTSVENMGKRNGG